MAMRTTFTRRKIGWVVGGGVGVVGLMVLVWVTVARPGIDFRQWIEVGFEAIRAAGAGWYFMAMALLPLPLAWFTIPAGEAFAGQLTLSGVVVAAAVAVALQLALSYGVARYALRPVVERMVRRRGLTVPRVTAGNALEVLLLVRLTPGPPMIVGTCILAIAETPFRLYLLVSWLAAMPWVVAGVVLGRGLLQGNFGLVASGVGLVVATGLVVRWWRHRAKERDRS